MKSSCATVRYEAVYKTTRLVLPSRTLASAYDSAIIKSHDRDLVITVVQLALVFRLGTERQQAMAHLICGVILIIVTLVVQNTLGELEQYLISNSETGGRKTWAEISEDPPRRQKRNAGYIFGVTNEEIQDIVITHNFLRNVSNPTAANMQQMVRTVWCGWKIDTLYIYVYIYMFLLDPR